LSSGPPSTWLARKLRRQHIPCANVALRALVHFAHTAQPSSSCASCFAPKRVPLCACVCIVRRSPERRVRTPYPCRLPRAACLAWLYALMHCTGAHPRPSRSTLVPLSLSAARPVIPPHMLSSPVPARILPACRGDLGPCARQFRTFDCIRPCRPNQSACRCHLVVHAEKSACTSRRPPAPPMRQHCPVCPACAAPKPPSRPLPCSAPASVTRRPPLVTRTPPATRT
jgi:hypothetical protein